MREKHNWNCLHIN